MKVIVIGGVAAGTSAAAQIMRNDKKADVAMYVKDEDVSYSSCGMPYYLGGEVELEELNPRSPETFSEKYGIRVITGHEVTKIHPEEKKIEGIKPDGSRFEDRYDELVIATGAYSVRPDLPGAHEPHVFAIRTMEDTRQMMEFIKANDPQHAVIVGTGFIGLEVLENLCNRGMKVTILNRSGRITPHLDEDMAAVLEEKLKERGVDLRKHTEIVRITKEGADTGEEVLPADLILFATGIKPETRLAEEAGVQLGEVRGIKVDDRMRTNIAHISACGDCVQTWSALDGAPMHVPLGTSANKTGKVCGDVLTGGSLRFGGILGTSIFKLFDLTIGTTGYSEKQARDKGYEVEILWQEKRDRADYFGGEKMMIKVIADKKTARLLGVQIIGKEGVDKRLDVLVTAITNKMSGDEIYNLDLAYSPPYSTVNDAVHYIGLKLRKLGLPSGQKE